MQRLTLVNGLSLAGAIAQSGCCMDNLVQQVMGPHYSPGSWKSIIQVHPAIGKTRVERLMRENGIQGRVVKVTRRSPGKKRFVAYGENLRLDEPKPTAINQVWVADVTYLKMNGEWRYLATVMDAYSRRILGWSLNRTRTVNLSLAALRNALKGRTIGKGLMFHTDRGIECTA